MPTVSYKLSFRTDQGTITDLGVTPRFTMTRADSPSVDANGCLKIELNNSAGGGMVEYAVTETKTFVDLGVPAGKYVYKARLTEAWTRSELGRPWIEPNFGYLKVFMDAWRLSEWEMLELGTYRQSVQTNWQIYNNPTAWIQVNAFAEAGVRFYFMFAVSGTQHPDDTYYWDFLNLELEYNDPPEGWQPPGDDGGGGPPPEDDENRQGLPGPPPDPWANIPYLQTPDCATPRMDTANSAINHPAIIHAWDMDYVYYITAGGRTLAYDTLTNAWTDCGYGQVSQAAVLRPDDMPEIVWLSPMYADWQGYLETLTRLSPMRDIIAASKQFTHAGGNSSWLRRLVLGPYGIEPAVRMKRKRALVFRLWGSITDTLPPGTTVVGRLTLAADSGWHETHDVHLLRWPNGDTFLPDGLLVEQRFSQAAVGRIFTVDVIFWRRGNPLQCVTISQSQLEYVLL